MMVMDSVTVRSRHVRINSAARAMGIPGRNRVSWGRDGERTRSDTQLGKSLLQTLIFDFEFQKGVEHGDVPAWIRLRYGEETTRTRFVVEIKGIAFEFEQDLRVRDVLHGEPGPATQTYVCVHLYACAEGVLERRMKGLLVFSIDEVREITIYEVSVPPTQELGDRSSTKPDLCVAGENEDDGLGELVDEKICPTLSLCELECGGRAGRRLWMGLSVCGRMVRRRHRRGKRKSWVNDQNSSELCEEMSMTSTALVIKLCRRSKSPNLDANVSHKLSICPHGNVI